MPVHSLTCINDARPQSSLALYAADYGAERQTAL